MKTNAPALSLVVLISGTGSNLQAILRHIEQGHLNAKVDCVISHREAPGFAFAKAYGIPTQIVTSHAGLSREAYGQKLLQVLANYQPQLVVLAGFIRILSPNVVQTYHGRLLNIHPSLLPAYKGLHTHTRVLAAGDSEHGVSIHFVDQSLDGGPIICQAQLKVLADDTSESLAKRVQRLEHQIYPTVIQWFAEGKLLLKDNNVYLDGCLLSKQGYLFSDLNP